MSEAGIERPGRHGRSIWTAIFQEFDRLIRQRHDGHAHVRPMRACHLAKELAPHLARPHELRAQAVHPKPERLVQRRDSEPDVVGATNSEAMMLGHVDFNTGSRFPRLQRAMFAETGGALEVCPKRTVPPVCFGSQDRPSKTHFPKQTIQSEPPWGM